MRDIITLDTTGWFFKMKKSLKLFQCSVRGKIKGFFVAKNNFLTQFFETKNFIAKLGGELKYIATASFGEKNALYVCPTIVKHSNPLSHISGVYNGIFVASPLTGDIMYYGRGAGRFPTAGAVTSDVIAVLSGAVNGEKLPVFVKKEGSVMPFDDVKTDCYIRTAGGAEELSDKLASVAEKFEIISSANGTVEAVACGVDKKSLDEVLPDARVIRILE